MVCDTIYLGVRMNIRNARLEDVAIIMEIYNIAKEYMIANNNPTQWPLGYPNLKIVKNDIKNGNLYVIENANAIHAVFTFIEGPEQTYEFIEEGMWQSDSIYGTIHRVAKDKSLSGVFDLIIDFCLKLNKHIRIDTHENNKIMQHLILKNGFKRCGYIYVLDGTKRIAYERCDKLE